MKTLDQLGVNLQVHGVRRAELEGALSAREGAAKTALFFRRSGLPLLVLTTVVSAFHAFVFLSGKALEEELYGYVSLANIISIDLLLLYLTLAATPLELVKLQMPKGSVWYLRVLVAVFNATVLLKDYGPVAGNWTEPLIPIAGSLAVALLLPFFLIATPATEGTRRRLTEATFRLNEEIAALRGALDTAVDPELVAARALADELTLKLTQAEANNTAAEERHGEALFKLNLRIDELEQKNSELELDLSDANHNLSEARAAHGEEQTELRRLLDAARERAAREAAPAVAVPKRRGERKEVTALCEGCTAELVGFNAVGTAQREAAKHGGKVLCKVCRTKEREGAA